MQAQVIDVSRDDGPDGSWEMARGPAHPGLAGAVRDYCGYVERSSVPVRRREVPTGTVPLILSFGDKIDVTMTYSSQRAGTFCSFVAGFHEGYALTEFQGEQQGFEIHLSPLGAYRLLGLPMSEVANQVVELDALRPRDIGRLVDRLAEAPGWPERFRLVDDALVRWIAEGPTPDPAVAWAWEQLRRTQGRVPVGALADEIGWSRRHLVARFRAQVGLPPKATARILRFRHALGLLDGFDRDHGTIADVAAAAGYADHSHLVREFRRLAGATPSQILDARHDDGGLTAA